MRTFERFLEDRGFQADACASCVDPDFYRLAAHLFLALEIIADPSTASLSHYGTVQTLRSHARNALKG